MNDLYPEQRRGGFSPWPGVGGVNRGKVNFVGRVRNKLEVLLLISKGGAGKLMGKVILIYYLGISYHLRLKKQPSASFKFRICIGYF